MKNRKTASFTLIELLVVISIIGILATLLLANFGGIRERARDAARKSDIKNIQNALEQYKNSQTPLTYPASGFDPNLITALESGNFMKVVPHDPKYDTLCSADCWEYSYTRDPDVLGDNLTYKLVACLENASDAQADASKDVYCTFSSASYTRTEP